jgi:chemotaxis protein methyltransferase CheR
MSLTRVDPEEIERRMLLEAIFQRYHYDFRHYAPASLRRRLRQGQNALGAPTLSALQERVLRDPALFAQLLQWLTVQVSELFRDPSYYVSIRAEVVPFLRTFPFFRIWIPGCGNGEEAWSMAILLKEEGLLDRALIYATDINALALRQAAAGVYDIKRVPGFSAAYVAAGGTASLAEYYTAGYGSVVFDRELRRNVVFSDHSLAADGVFAEVQFVSCRNVLIYFDRELQGRAVGLFRDSLCHRGFLGLGARESLKFTAHADAFEEAIREGRIYRRR